MSVFHWFGRLFFFAMAGLVATSSLLAQSASAEMKVGVVKTDRVLRESAPAKAADKKLEAEFAKRQKEVQDLANKLRGMSEKLERDATVMAEADRSKRQREIADMERDLQRRQREFREDLNQRRNEEFSQVLDRTNRAIRQIAESEKFDLIFQEENTVFASSKLDITEKVLKSLNAQSGSK